MKDPQIFNRFENLPNLNKTQEALKVNRFFSLAFALSAGLLSGCATIVNDPTVPVALAFSDASSGSCQLSNTRATYQTNVPGVQNVRRARSPLNYDCETNAGKTGVGSIPSSIEGAKLAASVVFFDFGITDSITEKSRTYPPSFVIPVQ